MVFLRRWEMAWAFLPWVRLSDGADYLYSHLLRERRTRLEFDHRSADVWERSDPDPMD